MKQFLSFILILSICSCGKTIENRISDEFAEYVNLNFDNPENFKEFVSIELKDTFNNNSLYDIVHLSYELDSLNEISFTLGDDFLDKLYDQLEINKSELWDLSYYKRERILEMSKEYIYLSCKKRTKSYKDNKHYIDSIYYSLDTFDVKNYKVRVRVLEDNKLKISDYYCILEDNSLRFYDKEPSLLELTPKCSSFWEILQEYNKETNEYLLLSKKRLDKQKEIIDYIRNAGIFINL